MASFGDPGSFYRNQDDVDNSTPVSALVVADPLSDGTELSILTDEPGGPTIPYGPSIYGGWSANTTPVPTSVSPAAYTFVISESVRDVADVAASAGANASFSELLAKGLLLPMGLNAGYTEDGWGYDKDLGIWERRFANDELSFTFSAYGDALVNVFVLVQDIAGVGGEITVEIAFWERTTGLKTKTASVFSTSAGTGFTQNLSLDVSTIIPSAASEMSLKITTGTIIAGAGGPFYQLKQIYWTPQ